MNGISIITVNYGTPRLLMNFVNSLEKIIDIKEQIEVIIVDNGYPHLGDSRSILSPTCYSFKIYFLQNDRTSYASAINQGAQIASRDILVAANSDIEIIPGTKLAPVIELMSDNPKIGIIGPQLVYPDKTWQRSYGRIPSIKEAIISLSLLETVQHSIYRYLWAQKIKFFKTKIVDYVDGAFMFINRKCFDECNGFNEDYSFYGEDADFCYRAKKLGWMTIFHPALQVYHIRGASSTKQSFIEYATRLSWAKVLFTSKHYGIDKARLYRKLLKINHFNHFLFYLLMANILPMQEILQHKIDAKLSYMATKNLPVEIFQKVI